MSGWNSSPARLAAVLVALALGFLPALGSASPADAVQAATTALDIDPAEGEPGTQVAAVATGFQTCPLGGSDDVGDPDVTFLWGDEDGLSELETVRSSLGEARVSFSVPPAASAGAHRVVARCAVDASMAAMHTFLVTPPPLITVRVPDLRGLSSEQAATLLEDARLVLGRVSGSGVNVVDQEPPPATEVPVESAVDVTMGTIAPELVEVPDVVGLTIAAAQDAISGARLSVGVISGDGELVGEQSLNPGTRVPPQTAVDLVLQEVAPQKVAVPDLVGLSLQDALSVLEPLGLRPVLSSGSDEDTINAQDPAPGTLLPVGSDVAVVTSRPTSVSALVLAVGILLLAVLVGTGIALLRRTRKLAERAWVAEHVHADLVRPVASSSSIADSSPENNLPRHVARIEPRSGELHSYIEEVGR